MKKPLILFVLCLFCVFAQTTFAKSSNDEASQACSEEGEKVRVSCIQKKCAGTVSGSNAQLKCEEGSSVVCGAMGEDVEKKCLRNINKKK